MEKSLSAVTVDGTTRVLGLIGNPVEHTLSPDIHNMLASLCGVNTVYVPFRVERGDVRAAVGGAYALNVLGLNVTVPHKQAVIPFLSGIEPLAEAAGAVNTLVRTPEGYRGYNTDMSGLYRAMREDGVRLQGEQVILLGAGGAGRAIAHLCAAKGAEHIWLLTRNREKAEAIARGIREKAGRDCITALELSGWKTLPDRGYLAVQATSVGLFPDSGHAVIEDRDFYRMIHTGYDLIYRPARTRFLEYCLEAGGRAYNGLKMLVYQGVEAFELWNALSVTPDVAGQIYDRLSRRFEQEQVL